jgi:hypothetical protein
MTVYAVYWEEGGGWVYVRHRGLNQAELTDETASQSDRL